LADLEAQLVKTPKNALAAQKQLRDEMDKLKSSIKDQKLSMQELNLQKMKLGQSAKALKAVQADLNKQTKDDTDVMSGLNTLTGGVVGQNTNLLRSFKALKNAVSSTSGAFNVLKGAIVSTGIGALVIAIGWAIEKLSKVVDDFRNRSVKAFEAAKNSAEDFNRSMKRFYDERIIEAERGLQIELSKAKIKGASDAEIRDKEIDGIKAINEERKKSIESQLMQNKRLRNEVDNALKHERDKTSENYIKLAEEKKKLNDDFQALNSQYLDIDKKTTYETEMVKNNFALAEYQRFLAKKAELNKQAAIEQAAWKRAFDRMENAIALKEMSEGLQGNVMEPLANEDLFNSDEIKNFSADLDELNEIMNATFEGEGAVAMFDYFNQMATSANLAAAQMEMLGFVVGDVAAQAFTSLTTQGATLEEFFASIGQMLRQLIAEMIKAAVIAGILSAAMKSIPGLGLLGGAQGIGGAGDIFKGLMGMGQSGIFGAISGQDLQISNQRAANGNGRSGR
jgi:hypothetical protein